MKKLILAALLAVLVIGTLRWFVTPPHPAASSNKSFRDSFKDGSSQGPEMVEIPAGSFKMGSNDYDEEQPIHPVTINKAFAIGKYEVTQEQWRAVMGDITVYKEVTQGQWQAVKESDNPSVFKDCGDTCPVEGVSWKDIQAFIQKLNAKTGQTYRLPSEAEWEYACQAGNPSYRYCGGNNEDSVAWYDKNSGKKTHPVGQKAANAWGLYDMSGNVEEWVQDCYIKNHDSNLNNESARTAGECKYRVIRGGSWGSHPKFLRTTDRGSYWPKDRSGNIGFRLVRKLQETGQ